jgi:pimeloyl-ACP methyl ester carboxylesterase
MPCGAFPTLIPRLRVRLPRVRLTGIMQSSARSRSNDAPVKVSEELFAPVSAGIELCYQTFGDPQDEPLVLVMGLGGPMTWWDPDLCEQLARAGFYVVRFDNRDIGRSSQAQGRVTRATVARAFVGARVRAPYTLDDMAADTFGLMDHLGFESAHVIGVSMGGMIAQTMAIAQPQRVRSLASIMSTTGKRTVGWQSPSLFPTLFSPRNDRDDYIAASGKVWELIGSPAYPVDEEEARQRAAETYDRGVPRSGVMRQMIAILCQPNRSIRLRSLQVPTLVVHGLADRMVHVSGGRATAAAIPGSELLLVDGMGHDLPPALYESLVSAIRRNADRAKG